VTAGTVKTRRPTPGTVKWWIDAKSSATSRCAAGEPPPARRAFKRAARPSDEQSMYRPRSTAPTRRTFLAASAATAAALHMSGDRVAGAATTAARPLPPWYDDVKLGVFIHWNAAAIPAYAPVHLLADLPGSATTPLPKWRQEQVWRTLPYAEMYQNTMAVPGSDTARYHAERHAGRTYDDFVARFRDHVLPAWSPEPWADLFRRAGAGYVVLTTKTEDGFLLWPSARANPHKPGWQATRDVTGELAAAVRRRGLRFGVYYSEGMDWTFGGLPITDDEKLIAAMPTGPEYAAHSDAHWRELIARYRPSVLWNDYGFLPNGDADALLRDYYASVPDGVVNDRFDMPRQASGELPADFVTLEYARTEGPADRKWEACRGLGTSFGYNRLETDASYLTSTRLIHTFVDIVAGGGNLLINVGPTETGEIPPEQSERLLALGAWLRVNSGAVNGTRRWRRAQGVTTSGLPVRYTAGADAVHAITLGTPRGTCLDIDVCLDPHAVVTATAGGARLEWTPSPHGTAITLPPTRPDTPALAVRLSPATAVRDPG